MDQKRHLLHLIRSSNPVDVQNALMRASDREIAMATRYMAAEEYGELLDKVAPAKAKRIEEERTLQEHLRITDEHYQAALTRIIDAVSGRKQSAIRSYIRPRIGRR